MNWNGIDENEVAILIIFHRDKPHSVMTTPNGGKSYRTYDVDYCKRDDQLYFRHSGSGPVASDGLHEDGGGETWLADGYALNSDADNKLIAVRPAPYDIHPGEWDMFEETTAYCTICKDNLPDESESPCEHLKWDKEAGDWGGPGADTLRETTGRSANSAT